MTNEQIIKFLEKRINNALETYVIYNNNDNLKDHAKKYSAIASELIMIKTEIEGGDNK